MGKQLADIICTYQGSPLILAQAAIITNMNCYGKEYRTPRIIAANNFIFIHRTSQFVCTYVCIYTYMYNVHIYIMYDNNYQNYRISSILF